MAKKKPIGKGSRGPKPKYPLLKWFDGKQHTLKFGVDFKSNVVTMKNYLYQIAKSRGESIKITTCLEIQSIPKKRGKKR